MKLRPAQAAHCLHRACRKDIRNGAFNIVSTKFGPGTRKWEKAIAFTAWQSDKFQHACSEAGNGVVEQRHS